LSNSGISPETVAKRIMNLISKPKNLTTFIPAYYYLTHPAERLVPSLIDKRCGVKKGWKKEGLAEDRHSQSVLITGASSGLGKELARLYARHAKNLYLSGRNYERLVQVQTELSQKYNCSIRVDSVDMADVAQVREYCGTIDEVDVIINNAAASFSGIVVQTPISKYTDMLKTNFYGPVLLTGEFMKKEQKPKKIINILSTTAVAGRKNHSCYSSTKAALWSFTKSLRRTFGDRVQIMEVIASTFPSALGMTERTDIDSEKYKKDKGFGRGLTAVTVAEKIFAAERSGRETLFVPVKARLFTALEAISPFLFRKIFG
jgi:short-subunit dehydrogenase